MPLVMGRDKARRSFTGQFKKKVLQQAKRKRTRVPRGKAEEKYIALRTGFSPRRRFDEVFDMMLSTHLRDEYVNNAQFNALLSLTGKIEAVRSQMFWRATRADMQRYFALAEKSRYDRKFNLTRKEAATRWLTGKQPKKIKYIRPKSYQAKPTSQYYPRPGSSAGKIKTNIIGAQRVNRDFAKFIKAIFSIGDGAAKIPGVKVTRTFR